MYNIEQKRWNAVVNNHWWGLGHYVIVEELMKYYLNKNQRNNLQCLDIGCSGGTIFRFLKQFGKVYGCDISFDGLIYCTNRSSITQADALKLPFKDETFDLLTVLDVAEHIDDDNLLFSEMYRVIKKEGIIFVNVPALSFFWRSHDVRYGHKRRYSRSNLVQLARRHLFRIEEIRYLHAHFVVPLFLSMLFDKLCVKSFGKRDDFISLGSIVDHLLLNTLLFESRLSRYIKFPFGISLFCILRKQE